MEMALALVFSRATIWSSECSTSSKLPRASSTTQTMSTLATLTAALRQKFCQALLKAKSMRFQSRCMVPSCIFVSDNLATLDGHNSPAHHVDNLSVVGRHQHRGAPSVDLEQQLDDLPGGRRVQVSGGLVREEDPRVVHQRPSDSDALLFTARELIRKLGLLSLQANDAEHLFHLRLEVPERALSDAQGEGHVLEDAQVGQQLEVLKDHPDLAPQVGQLTPLQAADVITLYPDHSPGYLLLADQQPNQGGLAGAAGPHQEDEILLWDFQADVAQGNGAVGIGLLHVLQADMRHGRDSAAHASSIDDGRLDRLGCGCCWHENKSIPKAGAVTAWALAGRIT